MCLVAKCWAIEHLLELWKHYRPQSTKRSNLINFRSSLGEARKRMAASLVWPKKRFIYLYIWIIQVWPTEGGGFQFEEEHLQKWRSIERLYAPSICKCKCGHHNLLDARDRHNILFDLFCTLDTELNWKVNVNFEI